LKWTTRSHPGVSARARSTSIGIIYSLGSGGGRVLIEHILYGKGHDVATIGPDASVADAVAVLRERNIGALVVIDAEDGIAGIISERDIVRALAEDAIGHPAILQRQVSDLMTRDVATCGSRSAVDDLMRVMTDRRIRHVPVVDEGRLNGIVSIGDVVKSRIGELETEAGTLHDYLSSGR
jgi:CBS domain-containing protein